MTDLLAHVEIIPARASHAPWILSTFFEHARRIDLSTRRQAWDEMRAVERILRGNIGRAAVVVPAGASDAGMGWALGLYGALLFGYVSNEFRRQGLGSALVATVAPTAPVRVAFWTRDAEAMRAHGFPIEYSIDAFRALCSYVRRDHRQSQHQARAT
jgi:GNAT superfamily N-acetyltransferase